MTNHTNDKSSKSQIIKMKNDEKIEKKSKWRPNVKKVN
jgi:hypothetical protein